MTFFEFWTQNWKSHKSVKIMELICIARNLDNVEMQIIFNLI